MLLRPPFKRKGYPQWSENNWWYVVSQSYGTMIRFFVPSLFSNLHRVTAFINILITYLVLVIAKSFFVIARPSNLGDVVLLLKMLHSVICMNTGVGTGISRPSQKWRQMNRWMKYYISVGLHIKTKKIWHHSATYFLGSIS